MDYCTPFHKKCLLFMKSMQFLEFSECCENIFMTQNQWFVMKIEKQKSHFSIKDYQGSISQVQIKFVEC